MLTKMWGNSFNTLREIKTFSHKSSIQMFIIALFTVAQIWKQLKYLLIDGQINKMLYNKTMEYYSAIKS